MKNTLPQSENSQDVNEDMKKLSKCKNHPDRKGVDNCASCGAPLCEECANKNHIYSVSAEAGLPYCDECYKSALRFLGKL